ncbi:hypothetical protein WA538_002500 [Blastocystis sp. DL]
MPITEKIGDTEEIDAKDWTIDMKVHQNTMDPIIFDFVRKSIAYVYEKCPTVSAVELRKYITIGCGPLFHVIASPKGINWSLDEQADQILSVTVKGTNYLVWRMLLNTKVFSEKNAPSTLDVKWLKFIPLIALVILIVMVALKYRECSGIATMNADNGFYDEELAECIGQRRNLVYLAVICFIAFVFVRRTQKKRKSARMMAERKLFEESIINKKRD